MTLKIFCRCLAISSALSLYIASSAFKMASLTPRPFFATARPKDTDTSIPSTLCVNKSALMSSIIESTETSSAFFITVMISSPPALATIPKLRNASFILWATVIINSSPASCPNKSFITLRSLISA